MSNIRHNNTEFILILSGLFLAAKVKSSQKKTEVGLESLKQEVEFWILALWFNGTELELLDMSAAFVLGMKAQFNLGCFASLVTVSLVHVHRIRKKNHLNM